jgi:hypothetical protein
LLTKKKRAVNLFVFLVFGAFFWERIAFGIESLNEDDGEMREGGRFATEELDGYGGQKVENDR